MRELITFVEQELARAKRESSGYRNTVLQGTYHDGLANGRVAAYSAVLELAQRFREIENERILQ